MVAVWEMYRDLEAMYHGEVFLEDEIIKLMKNPQIIPPSDDKPMRRLQALYYLYYKVFVPRNEMVLRGIGGV